MGVHANLHLLLDIDKNFLYFFMQALGVVFIRKVSLITQKMFYEEIKKKMLSTHLTYIADAKKLCYTKQQSHSFERAC